MSVRYYRLYYNFCRVFKRECLGRLEVYFVIMVTDPIWFERPVVEPEDRGSYSHYAAGWTSWFDSWQGQGPYHFCSTFRSAKSPTWLPIEYIPEALSSGGKRPGVMLSTHCHLLPRLRWSGVIPLLRSCLHGMDKDNFIYFMSAAAST